MRQSIRGTLPPKSVERNHHVAFKVVTGIAGLMVATGLFESVADACSFAAPEPYTLDPVEQAQDTQVPAVPQISNFTLARGRATDEGCGGSSTLVCDSAGSIAFQVDSIDDRTPPADLGYQITLVRGRAPAFFMGTDRGPLVLGVGQTVRRIGFGLILTWEDGSQDDLDFDLEIRATDLAGNVSAEAVVVPVRDVNSACRIGDRGGSRYDLAIGLLVFLIAWRRKPTDGRSWTPVMRRPCRNPAEGRCP